MLYATHVNRIEVIRNDMHIQAIHERVQFETNQKYILRQTMIINNSLCQMQHVTQ